MLIHVVKRGETIYTIAAQYGVTPYDIISTNELTNPDRLVPGQTLVILFPDQIYITRAGDTIYSIALANNTS
ncbi:MAG: LysM domain-containing protein, partial [Bacillota bacterium]|nr:LysM domain-containing protein [Bacillota bacterium]